MCIIFVCSIPFPGNVIYRRFRRNDPIIGIVSITVVEFVQFTFVVTYFQYISTYQVVFVTQVLFFQVTRYVLYHPLYIPMRIVTVISIGLIIGTCRIPVVIGITVAYPVLQITLFGHSIVEISNP